MKNYDIEIGASNTLHLEATTRKEYKEELTKPRTWEDTVDGLGMEDFPERDTFMEAGALLREASRQLKRAVNTIEGVGRSGGQATKAELLGLAIAIERFLQEGKE